MTTKTKQDRGIKICVLTGATSGLGRAAAFQLGSISAQLILLSRNASKGREIATQINSSLGLEKALFMQTDLSRLSEVRTAADQIKKRCQRIDVLINNAGARFNDFNKNDDGIELTFATNHLGHFLLTHLLADHLEKSAGARIITVASDAHCGYSADFDYVKGAGVYDRKAAYGRSKLANILFTYELARRLAGTRTTANALHPGGVATGLGRNNGMISWLKHIAYYALKRQLLSPARAAEAITYLALSDEVQGVTGKYFFGKKEIRSSDVSYDQSAGRKLWEVSLQLCGIDETAH
jgi:NAD(P)-dependent dehydrogenase (short-subunit alcohol dehydrogenase family)